ncbi:RNA polymerase sigma factor [Streptomyces neyagawaensis]|uniref:RNA polymerase sigma factor n=1 Tax=Streptomyces neyagawaensis TaxID=42238 RepID=UPI0006E3C766|nr:sigma-70 family RNA polymerase sigma factor [Streptomyces neyagawaensis]MCL6737432.1 sigma-70 family RNA polymerase sigma factor [Streptomyces neyagawaensis]
MADRDRPRSRHADALRELVAEPERYGLMVRYAASQLGNHGVHRRWADPEDVVQNALAAVLAKDGPIRVYRPYVYACIRREAGRAARRYHAGQGYASLDLDLRAEGELAVPAFEGEVELRDVKDRTLAGLPVQQQRAYFLTQELGMPHAQAGKVLGIAAATVGVHSSRATRKVRAALSEAGVGAAVLAWVIASIVRGKQEIIPGAGPEMLPVSYTVTMTVLFMVGLSSIVLGWATSASGRPRLRSSLASVREALGILPEQGGGKEHGDSDPRGFREQFVLALWAGIRHLARSASRYLQGALLNNRTDRR